MKMNYKEAETKKNHKPKHSTAKIEYSRKGKHKFNPDNTEDY